jgi:pimeloyl-ACP methyl ester carboxylesterase
MRRLLVLSVLPVFVACGGGGGGSDPGPAVDPGTDPGIVDPGTDTATDTALPDAPMDPGVPDVPSLGDMWPPDEGTPPADTPVDTPADVPLPSLAWAPCDTTHWPVGYPKPSAAVECAFLEVPFDRAKPDGVKVTLRLGRHKSKKFPTGKAVFNLAGGPGGTSVGQAGTIPLIMPSVLEEFDLVYVDQRGTGGSGYMDCPLGYPESQKMWEKCAEQYKDMDRTHYLTVDAADDLDAARAAMGYDKIYLRGGSYGTRLGLEYLRRHEDRVAGIVLDGLCTPDTDLFGYDVTSVDHGVDLLVADCNADPACRAVVPDLKADLLGRLSALSHAPHVVLVGGQEMQEDAEVFKYLVSGYLYTATWRFRIPRAVHEAVNGDNTLWNKLMSEVTGAKVEDKKTRTTGPLPRVPRPRLPGFGPWRAMEYVAPGVLATVACTEWMPNSKPIADLEAKLKTTTWGQESMLDLPRSCPKWIVGPMDPKVLEPVSSKLPVLLLSGAIDLNTPFEWGTHAAETLANGTHFIIPYASHSTMQVPCVANIIAAYFQQDCDLSKLSTKCIEELKSPAW